MPLPAFITKLRMMRRSAAEGAVAPCDKTDSLARPILASRRVSRLLVLTCLILSVATSNYVAKSVRTKALFEFDKLSVAGTEVIKKKIMTYGQILTGAAAHVGAVGVLDAEGFTQYVAGLNLKEKSPGIVGFTFAQFGPDENIITVNRSLTDVSDRLLGSSQMGLDIRSETGLIEALERARINRQTTLTPQLGFYSNQEPQEGFALVQAVYVPIAMSLEGEVMKDEFVGWVIAPCVAKSMVSDLAEEFSHYYHLTVFDSAQPDEELVSFDNSSSTFSVGAFRRDHVTELHGRRWVLRFESTQEFDKGFSSYLPAALLFVGFSFSFFLWFSMRSVALRCKALKAIADLRTRQLDASIDENRTLLETSGLAVITLDDGERITFANSTAGMLFGWEPQDMIGRDFDRFVTLNGMPLGNEIANATGDGPNCSALMLDVQVCAGRTVSDNPQITVLIRDVTEQLNRGLAIETLQNRYDVALTGAGIGIFEVDLIGDRSIFSDTWHKIMGIEDLTIPFDHQEHFKNRIHPDDLPLLMDADRRCISGEAERSEAEYRVSFPEGWRWMFSDAVPMGRDRDGLATRLVGTQVDVTDLRHARNALELSEARFRMMLEVAPVGMAVLNERGAFIGVNAALATLCGYDSDILQDQMRLADLLKRKDFVRMSRDIRGLLSAGHLQTYQNEFELRTQSGEMRWGLFNVSWTYDKNRAENVYIAQIVDITDQKRIGMIKSEFVATVSHELRTPLTSIKGALNLLEVSATSIFPDNAQRLLEIASLNADRLTVIVNDILDLEKLSSGEVMFECEDTSLHDVIEQTLDLMKPFAAKHQNTLILPNENRGIAVHVDVMRLRQALKNLISNACKFSDIETSITVRYETLQNDVAIYVENTGPIVPESFRSQMFDAFTQVDGSDTRTKGGTGLGLNIARQIIRQLGGHIWFDQDLDGKIVFWFTCPPANAIGGGDAVSGANVDANNGPLP